MKSQSPTFLQGYQHRRLGALIVASTMYSGLAQLIKQSAGAIKLSAVKRIGIEKPVGSAIDFEVHVAFVADPTLGETMNDDDGKLLGVAEIASFFALGTDFVNINLKTTDGARAQDVLGRDTIKKIAAIPAMFSDPLNATDVIDGRFTVGVTSSVLVKGGEIYDTGLKVIGYYPERDLLLATTIGGKLVGQEIKALMVTPANISTPRAWTEIDGIDGYTIDRVGRFTKADDGTTWAAIHVTDDDGSAGKMIFDGKDMSAQIELAPEDFKGYYPVAEVNAPSLGNDLPDTKVVFTETPKGTMLLRRDDKALGFYYGITATA